jgi:hypothetical protein
MLWRFLFRFVVFVSEGFIAGLGVNLNVLHPIPSVFVVLMKFNEGKNEISNIIFAEFMTNFIRKLLNSFAFLIR